MTQEIAHPSPELIDVVSDAQLRQDWYRNYVLSNDGGELTFVGSLKPSKDVVGAAERIRRVIRWDAVLSNKVSSSEEALSLRIKAVEDARILVMRSGVVGNSHRKLSVDEFRGFALSDKYAPLIFINGNDAKAAQMFTLAHELVHIWLGVSGISNLLQTYSLKTRVEAFCNAVAGELLVPTERLKEMWRLVENEKTSKGIDKLTRVFRVSSLVILRRLRDVEALPEDEFQLRYTNEVNESKFKQKASSGGGEFYRTLEGRLGTRFASALVESTLEGTTPYREAIQLQNELGVVFSIRRVADELEVKSDEVAKWIRRKGDKFFLPPDKETSQNMALIGAWLFRDDANYLEGSRAEFMNGSDLILVAQARALGYTVVTQETLNHPQPKPSQPSHVKIPNVCKQFGVRPMTLTDAIRATGAKFILE